MEAQHTSLSLAKNSAKASIYGYLVIPVYVLKMIKSGIENNQTKC